MARTYKQRPRTPHQIARRARKSKAFFAKLAQRAALAADQPEALRLLTASQRKRHVQACFEPVARVAALAQSLAVAA